MLMGVSHRKSFKKIFHHVVYGIGRHISLSLGISVETKDCAHDIKGVN